MTDAVRNVTIRINVVAGDIEKQDMSWLAVAREDATKLSQSMQSVVESQKGLAKSEEILKTAVEETADAIKKSNEATLEEQEKRAKAFKLNAEERVRTNKEALDRIERDEKEKADREAARLKGIQDIYDAVNKKLSTPEAQAASAARTSKRPLTEPGEANIANQQKEQQRAEEAARKSKESIAEAARAIVEESEAEQTAIAEKESKKRAKQAEQEAKRSAREIAREQEQSVAQAEQATERLPREWQKVTQGLMSSSAAATKFGMHMTMLMNNGGKDTEALAKKFVELQSKIGIVTEAKALFTGVGKTINDLETVSKLTQRIVDEQIRLGVATTASQQATIGLGHAARFVTANMFPLALAATAVAAAVIAIKLNMEDVPDFATKTKEEQEKLVTKTAEWTAHLERATAQLETESRLLETQKNLMQDKLDIQNRIDGKKTISTGDLKKQDEEMTKQNTRALDKRIDQEIMEMRKTIQTPDVARAFELLDKGKTIDKNISQLQGKIDAAEKGGVTPHEKFTIAIMREELKENKQNRFLIGIESKKIEERTGVKHGLEQLVKIPEAMQSLKEVKVEDGLIKNMPKMIDALEELPVKMQKQFLGGVSEQVAQQKDQTVKTFDAATQSIEAAKSKQKEVEAGKKTEAQKLDDQEDLATKYTTRKGARAETQARDILGQLKDSTDVNERQRLAGRAKEALQQGGLLTDEITTQLDRGANVEPAAVTARLDDDKTVTKEEREETDKKIAELTQAGLDAQNIIDTAPRLLEALKKKLEAIAQQQDELYKAIENRD